MEKTSDKTYKHLLQTLKFKTKISYYENLITKFKHNVKKN